mmetsp:Transcript_4426/g.11415  ORF Transcript_4426/g.11415 Transcript_4426/m.11415 type:complete len:262 (+) Transcript_4426:2536-3321(+)
MSTASSVQSAMRPQAWSVSSMASSSPFSLARRATCVSVCCGAAEGLLTEVAFQMGARSSMRRSAPSRSHQATAARRASIAMLGGGDSCWVSASWRTAWNSLHMCRPRQPRSSQAASASVIFASRSLCAASTAAITSRVTLLPMHSSRAVSTSVAAALSRPWRCTSISSPRAWAPAASRSRGRRAFRRAPAAPSAFAGRSRSPPFFFASVADCSFCWALEGPSLYFPKKSECATTANRKMQTSVCTLATALVMASKIAMAAS